jgi:predicted GNAT family N-acyltransferase
MIMQLVHQLTDPQIAQLHQLYQNEWWSANRTYAETATCAKNSSLIFAFVENEQLLAFARVLTDGVFKAFLFDVIIAPENRNHGLGRELLNAIKSHPRIRPVKHLELYCVAELIPYYQRYGFSTDVGPVNLMRCSRR